MGPPADMGRAGDVHVLNENAEMTGRGGAIPAAATSPRALVLGLLFAANVVNYIDRQIVTILQEPIKADLGLSDTQLGLLTGLSFALFYATLGVPIARLADRHSRTRIIAGSITLWSVMTAACAAAGNFWTLLLCRCGVGVGEAGLSPSAHSMISDYYEPHRRASALAVYSAGIQAGVMLGFLLGGAINHLFGWRAAFIVIGAPGLLLALAFRLLIKEPPRGRFDDPAAVQPQPGGLGATVALLWRNRPFRFAALACGFHALVLYGHGHWAPPFLGRVHNMAISEIAMWLALLAAIPGGVGIWVSGIMADRAEQARPGGRLRVAIWSIALLIPCEIAYVMAPTAPLALAMSVATHFLAGFYLAPVLAFAHGRVGSQLRASASAMVLLALNLIGLGIGPVLVGGISDLLAAQGLGPESIRFALLAIIPAQLVALALFTLARRSESAEIAVSPRGSA